MLNIIHANQIVFDGENWKAQPTASDYTIKLEQRVTT